MTNAKLTEGGSSDGVACDWLSGMVPMALILGLEEEGGLKGLRVLWVLEVKFWVSEKEDRPYELSWRVPIWREVEGGEGVWIEIVL